MKIKITKSGGSYSWYRNKIGETFNVLKTNYKEEHHVVYESVAEDRYVCFSDCEILNEKKKP